MKENRNIKKIFQSIVFTLFTFFIFGVINVDAKTVSVTDGDAFLNEFKNAKNLSDVVQLANDVDLSVVSSIKNIQLSIYKDKTIDLNGYNLTISAYGIKLWYYKNATVKFIDSSNSKSGKIIRTDIQNVDYRLFGVSNLEKASCADTFLVFDGVKIYRETDNDQIKVVAPDDTTTDKTINKVSFINTDITNFALLNVGTESENFYYENVTFKRGVNTNGYLLNSSGKTVNDVISDNSEIIKEKYDGTYMSTYDKTTTMNLVKTSNDVIKVRYINGVSVSNVNFALDYGYTSTSQNITIKNSGQENVTITNVTAGANFDVTGPTSGVTLAVGGEDTSWSISPKAGLGGGTYVDTITVTAGGKTYTSTVTLTVNEKDSEGNTVVYVSDKDELNSAIEAGTKYIKFADDISYSTGFVQIPVNGDVTIDLNGKTLYTYTGYFGLKYEEAATVKITDTSSAKSGKIIENGYGTSADAGIIKLTNNADETKECNFIIDGVNVTSTSNRYASMIIVDGNSLNSVKLINSLFSNYYSVLDGSKIVKITFENVKATSASDQRIYLVDNRDELTFGDIITDDSEVAYLKIDGSFIRTPDNSTTVKYDTLQNGQSIQVRYKSGFNVTAESKTISYGDSTDEYFIINITNRGITDNNILNVSIDNTNFELLSGTSGIVNPGMTISNWKIKVKDGVTLEQGVYTVNISVEDSEHNIYRGTFTLTVNPKTLSELSIEGIPNNVTYGDTISPTIGGTESGLLSNVDYVISYEKFENGSYVRITDKPKNVGKYRAVLKPRTENYTFDEKYFEFEIVAKDISGQITINIGYETYDGNEKRPSFTALLNGSISLDDSDYTFTYSDNVDAGQGKLTLSPVEGSNYKFDVFTKKFTINPNSLNASDVNVTLTNTSYKYTGSPIEPQPEVKDGDKTLVLGTDYTLDYEDNTNSGNTANVVVKGIGNYKDVIRVSFVITPKETQTVSFEESSITKTYVDDSFTNTASTTGNGTISYTSSNTSVAEVDSEGRVTIKGAGSAEITATASETDDYGVSTAKYILTVNPKEISFRARVNNKVYDGNNTAVVGDIYFEGLVGSDALALDTDYRILSALFENSNAGNDKNVKVKIELINTALSKNYILTNSVDDSTANIGGITILDGDVTLGTETLTYDGNEKRISVSVKVNGVTLTKDNDYELVYSNNTNAGVNTAEVKVIGIGNYTGTIVRNFSIDKKNIILNISDISDVVFNDSQHKPSITVKDRDTDRVLDINRDYTLSYGENKNAGLGTIDIYSVSTSNYKFGMTTKNFNITKYNIIYNDVTLSYYSVIFDGTSKKPSVTVKMGDTIIPDSQYEVIYDTDTTSAGVKNVLVKILDSSSNYKGSVTKNYTISNKTILTISGISDQSVTYTGSSVELVGSLSVSNGISADDLTVKWYKGSTEISRPTNVGSYVVEYSYEDENYVGSLRVNVEITKKTSEVPTLTTYEVVEGSKLSTITLPNRFKWVDANISVSTGLHEYNATYATNNDSANYTVENVLVKVYGKSKVNVSTSVNGIGGIISASKTDVIEGTTEEITFTPNDGYELDKVLVDGVDKTNLVTNNKLSITLGTSNVNVVVSYKLIKYTITINNVENATINPSGVIEVDYNTSKEFTIKANNGYKLVSVKVNSIEMLSSISNDKLTLSNVKGNASIVVVVEKITYQVIEGSNQKYVISKNNEAIFRIDADYSKFESVYVDDELLSSENYTSKSGSTIITLKKDYVDSLSEGVHTLKVKFSDGEASTTFSVEKTIDNPVTNDNILLYIISAITSMFALGGTITYIYKKKTN